MTQPPNFEMNHRIARLRELGIGEHPDDALDAFAKRLAEAANAPYAMVNLTNAKVGGQQYFAGLHVASNAAAGAEDVAPQAQVSRTMPRDHGYCPHVLEKEGLALVLADVTEWSAFGANEVHDQLGINSYAGAGLVDERTGTMLGTVCIVDTVTRPKAARDDLIRLIKEHRDQVMQHIYDRTGGAPR